MDTIASFTIDHTKLQRGIYISRIDGDITTYDLRTKRPNLDSVMDNSTMHTTEHLFATFVRNSSIGQDVIYFGPMGCQTGFYLLVRNAGHEQVLSVIKEVLGKIIAHEGEVFGSTAAECGNYQTLKGDKAKHLCREYLDIIKDWTAEKMTYQL